MDKYVVIETGGSIGECSSRGRTRLGSLTIYDNKEDAKKQTRKMAKLYGGGYYNYHYSTKTLEWAKKNLRSSEMELLK